MFRCAPAPHKVRPSLCRNRALHLFDRLNTADNIQAVQGAFPHQSSEGHHRRMFACHLQVSTPSHVFHLCIRIRVTCVYTLMAAAFNCIINLKTGESSLRKHPGLFHTPTLPQTSPYLLQALFDPCEEWGRSTAQALSHRVVGPGDEIVFQA